MSYFVFGFIDLDKRSRDVESRECVKTDVRRCANAVAIWAAVEDPREQALLAKMRGLYAPDASLPFFLTRAEGEDTSHSLLAPSPGGIRDSVPSVQAIADWLSCLMTAGNGVIGARLWFSEGFDVNFESHACRPKELASLYERRLFEEKEIPSMLITVRA